MRFNTVLCEFLAVILTAGCSVSAWGEEVAAWDFTKGLQGWQGNPYVKDLAVSTEGLAFTSTGIDPWIEGPAIDLPGSGMTRVHVRMKSQADAHAELFYGRVFEAGRSVQFSIQNDGQWHEYAVLIADPLGPGTRLRLDPATDEGRIVVASIRVETLTPLEPPQFKRPERPTKGTAEPLALSAGGLRLEHYQGALGDFVLDVDGVEMAAGYRAEQIGVMFDNQAHWLSLDAANVHITQSGSVITVTATRKDEQAGQWKVTRRFAPGRYRSCP